MGDQEAALKAFEKAERVYQAADNQEGIGIALHNRALVYEDQGKWEEAAALYQQELDILEELGDEVNKAVVLSSWGDSPG